MGVAPLVKIILQKRRPRSSFFLNCSGQNQWDQGNGKHTAVAFGARASRATEKHRSHAARLLARSGALPAPGKTKWLQASLGQRRWMTYSFRHAHGKGPAPLVDRASRIIRLALHT